MKKLFLLLLASTVVLFTSCITSTNVHFNSNVEGVRLVVDGVPVGQTPCNVRMSNAIWANHEVIVQKEGYQTRRYELACDIKMVNIISGLFLFEIPYLWCYGPKSNQYIIMFEDETVSRRLAEDGETIIVKLKN